MIRCDALVIGGGLSARRCADILSEKYNTLLIHDGGGASPYIHGICIPLDKEDSVEKFIEDTLSSGKYQNDGALVRTLCEGARELADEFSFDRREDGSYDLLRPLGASCARVASIHEHTGAYVMGRIARRRRFAERGDTRAVRILTDGGRAVGALCFDKASGRWFSVAARCVCLATGGFGGVFPFSTNSSDIGGDGIAMAYEAGATLRDMEFIQFEPTAALSPPALVGKSVITTMLYEGATFRNGKGECFLTVERVDKDVLSKAIYREIKRGNATRLGGVLYDATGVPRQTLMTKYKSYYERYLNVGVDICNEPMEVAPAPHTTLGGVVIDTGARTEIEGFFAMGEVTGGLHGANRLGGNAGLEVLVFGKLAAESALAYLDRSSAHVGCVCEPCEEDLPTDLTREHARVREIAGESLGVIRSGEQMERGREELCAIVNQLRPLCQRGERHSYAAYRAYNDALTVLLSLESALARRGSLGAHERADGVTEDVRYTVFISKRNGLKKETIL